MPALPLAADFFQPGIVAQPGEVAWNLKYLASDNAQEVDEKMVDGLRDDLFPNSPVLNHLEVGASDLYADDVQRGRDEGDPTYNEARIAVGEQPVTSFAQITSNVQLQQQLRQLYGNVNDVELFAGLMAEDHLPGSSLGPTEQAILAQQFEALRDGDHFFYKNADSPSLVNQLNNTTLAQVIERNTPLTNLQPNVFFFYNNIQGAVTAPAAPMAGHDAQGPMAGDGAQGPMAGDGAQGPMAGQPHPLPGIPHPLAGITVDLLQDGQVVATTKTDEAGHYLIQQAGAGRFTVDVELPDSGAWKTLSPSSVEVDITRGQAGPAGAAGANFVVQPPAPPAGMTPPGGGSMKGPVGKRSPTNDSPPTDTTPPSGLYCARVNNERTRSVGRPA